MFLAIATIYPSDTRLFLWSRVTYLIGELHLLFLRVNFFSDHQSWVNTGYRHWDVLYLAKYVHENQRWDLSHEPNQIISYLSNHSQSQHDASFHEIFNYLNYPPQALRGLLKQSGLKGGKSDTVSHCSFTFTFMHLADAFIQSDLQVIHFLSVCVFPGNRTHNLCAANAML